MQEHGCVLVKFREHGMLIKKNGEECLQFFSPVVQRFYFLHLLFLVIFLMEFMMEHAGR